MTLREAADQLGVRVKTVRNLLSRHRARFDVPTYDQAPPHPPVRRLSDADVAMLGTLLAAYRLEVAAVAAARSSGPRASWP